MVERKTDRAGIHSLANIDQIIHTPARLTILIHLFVVKSADFIFLKNSTRLTWGNLSAHLSKLEEAGYVAMRKEFKGKKPHTTVRLTDTGRAAFRQYRQGMQKILGDLPD